MLLVANDAAGPHGAQPGDGLMRYEAVQLHEVQRDERAGAAQACLAVDGEGSRCSLGEEEELGDHVVRRGGAILKEETGDCNAGDSDRLCVVAELVEPHDYSDVKILQDGRYITGTENA